MCRRPLEPDPGNAGVGSVPAAAPYADSPLQCPLEVGDMRWSGKTLILLAIVVIIILGIGYWLLTSTTTGERKVVIYTYESLLKWGDDPNTTIKAVFGGFERKYNCEVEVREFDDARTALLTLLQEKDSPKADVIIGIDNVLIHEAIESEVLEPFEPSNIGQIYDWLISSLDPTYHVIPYDYGLISLVYDSKRISDEDMRSLTFERLASREYSSKLITEDPTVSSTGINFLLWQIAYYKMKGGDWRQWWKEALNNGLMVAGSWGDAYDIFLDEKQGRPIVVSYGTDGAYSYHFYQETRYKAALITINGEEWGWLQIEGLGLVRGAPHKELAKKFIERLKNLQQTDLKISGKVLLAAAILLRVKSYRFMDEDINALESIIKIIENFSKKILIRNWKIQIEKI